MKENDMFRALSIACFISGVLMVVSTIMANRGHESLCDLRLRYNEAQCAHAGINPFHVWNGDVVSKRFRGLSRPDRGGANGPSQAVSVHAYPPWHMAYTWFYGKVSFQVVVAFCFLLSGVSMCSLCWQFKKKELAGEGSTFYWAWLFLAVLAPCMSCFCWGNYGVIIAGLLLLMVVSIEKDLQVLAGIAWALMMIKPQVGSLFFFPLIFQKKYKAIFVSGLICCSATLWVATIYNESPVELILQIPQIGAPYETSAFWGKLCPVSFRVIGKAVWLLICVALCGYTSWQLRNSKEYLMRYVPAALFFSLWTYSSANDIAVSWPLSVMCVLWGVKVVRSKEIRSFGVVWFFVLQICGTLFCSVWEMGVACDWFVPTGRGWIYAMVKHALCVLTCVFVLFLYFKRNYIGAENDG